MRHITVITLLFCLVSQPVYARPSLRSLQENAIQTEESEAGWRMQYFSWDGYGLRTTYPGSWREPSIVVDKLSKDGIHYDQARLMPQDNELGQRKNYLLELTALVWSTRYQLDQDELEAFARTQTPTRYKEYYLLEAEPTTVAGYPAWRMRFSSMTGPREETWVSAGRFTYTLGFRSRNDEYFASDHFFYEDYLASAKITPVEPMAKEEVQERTEYANTVGPFIFSDVGMYHPYVNAIDWAKNTGVVSGYPDGSFRPEQTVNRAELLKILYQASGADAPSSAGDTGFPDVPEDAWFAPYVSIAKQHGIVQGYPDGIFQPEQTVNAAEALKMAYRVLGIETTPSGDVWYQEYFEHAENHGIFKIQPEPSSGMKRQDIVWILWRLLQ